MRVRTQKHTFSGDHKRTVLAISGNAKARDFQKLVTGGAKSIELVGRRYFSQNNVSTASNPAGRSNLSNVSTICSGEATKMSQALAIRHDRGFSRVFQKIRVARRFLNAIHQDIKSPDQISFSLDLGQESSSLGMAAARMLRDWTCADRSYVIWRIYSQASN